MDGSLAPDGWPARTSLGPKRMLLIGLDGQRIKPVTIESLKSKTNFKKP